MSFPAALGDTVSPRFCRLDLHLEVAHENPEGTSVECTSLAVVVFNRARSASSSWTISALHVDVRCVFSVSSSIRAIKRTFTVEKRI
jgi:hypothetical protein